MRVLIVSYLEGITDAIIKVVKDFDENAEIDITTEVIRAHQRVYARHYDVIIIDMMTPFKSNNKSDNILEPALSFLKGDKAEFPKKVFVLFDPEETGDEGKDKVREMGYAISDYIYNSKSWERDLFEYIAF